MYLAMARVAYREGYPEVGMYYEKAAYEEAEHAAKFAELLGEVVTPSTKKNLVSEISVKQTLEAASMSCFVLSHFMNSVMDSVIAKLLCSLSKLQGSA